MSNDLITPGFVDVLNAKKTIAPFLRPTPFHHYPALDQITQARIYVKHENYQPISAFKVRGGMNLVSQLSASEKERGVITASTGNHGQSIAYAARIFGIKAAIVVPEGANPVKIQAIRSHGAQIVFHGKDFDDARAYCEDLAKKEGFRFISSGDEPLLIAGVGTHTLEILEEQPKIDVVIVPVGGGSGAAGACIVAKTMNPNIQVIGVQSVAAPAAYLTWKERKRTEAKMETMAEGLATRSPFMLPQSILWKYLDEFLLVEEDELRNAVFLYLEKVKTLAEPAGAAPLAAVLKFPEKFAGKTLALILSGGNISPEQLRQLLNSKYQQS
jgi:threonine dehydratase